MLKAQGNGGVEQEALRWLEETVIGAGWRLPDPSPECLEALATPRRLQRAPYWNRIGVHTQVVALKLLLGFWRGPHPDEARGGLLGPWAMYLLAQFELGGLREITLEELQIRHNGLQRWRETVFLPAQDRLRAATDEQVLRDPGAYHPALSHAALVYEQQCIDYVENKSALELGLSMHEEGRLLPEQRVKLSEFEQEQYFHFLSEARKLAFIGSSGLILVAPRWVKAAADTRLGKTKLAKEVQPEKEVEIADPSATFEPLCAAESVVAMRRLAEARLRSARCGTAKAVAWNAVQAAARRPELGWPTVRELSAQSGIPVSTMALALQQVREEVAAALVPDE